MAHTEWTREKTQVLITEYRKRRGLWDMTHDDYRKKDVKQNLLAEVSASLGDNIPVAEVEKKFHTLRTQYHREINRMKHKEPYNSKWFGFKSLQFLSSPKACRSNKGRIKTEITEEGTMTTKYILREASEEPGQDQTAILFEAIPATGGRRSSAAATSASVRRSHELEKLIEETTKDVEDTEDSKPKLTPYNPHSTSGSSGAGEINNDQDPLQTHHAMEEEEEQIETIDIQTATEEEAAAFTVNSAAATSTPGGTGGQNSMTTARIIKIQRRSDDYYENGHQPQSGHTYSFQSGGTPSGAAGQTKRIFYDANGHQHTATIVNASIGSVAGGNATLTNSSLLNSVKSRNNLSQKSSVQSSSMLSTPQRDEFAIYGEYVSNEMRNIMSREILTELKQRINTALFEATMQELQK